MGIEYIRKNIVDVLNPDQIGDLYRLRQVPELKSAFETGWVAGGFARHLLGGGRVHTYFSSDKKWVDDDTVGDIDFFFPDVETAHRAYKDVMYGRTVGFAQTIALRSAGFRFKAQFVNHPSLCKPTLDDTLNGFDFMNCMVAIDGESIVYPEGWHDLEKTNRLKIVSAHSPFLGGRILKYLTHRGFNGITDDSAHLLKEWFASIAGNKFDSGIYANVEERYLQNSLTKLRGAGLVEKEDLVFFINRWKVIQKDEQEYGQEAIIVTKEDWALSEMMSDV